MTNLDNKSEPIPTGIDKDTLLQMAKETSVQLNVGKDVIILGNKQQETDISTFFETLEITEEIRNTNQIVKKLIGLGINISEIVEV